MEITNKLIIALLPLIAIQFGLIISAVVSWSRRESFNHFNKWVWLVIILLVNTIGPILYFIIGRKDESSSDYS